MTQVELAEASGVAQTTISKLEGNPKSRPTFQSVAALARALTVDPLDLCFGPDPRSKPRRSATIPPATSKAAAV